MPFSSFGLHPDLIRGIKDLAFTHPTPIQTEAIPPALEGRDVLACAMTGSGKTAAFMLPTLHRLMSKPPAVGGLRRARALVLTPTRELAVQILDHLSSMAVHTPISGAAIIGGVGMGQQAHAFRTGTEILIATPGRLMDHMRQAYARLDGLEILILDEADRMLDMGFLPDIKRILRVIPAKRQTLFFSATMPPEIRKLTVEMLKDPVSIQIERQTTPAAGITQAIYPVPQHLKTALLVKLLEHESLDSVICFTRTKHRANRLALSLTQKGISCVPIHGNRSQGQRTAALSGFKAGRYRVLVATDIAARGIDIADVSHVINFDCPHIAEDYIHRIGRTGRAAAVGDAFTFVADDENGNLRTIERAIGKRLPRVTLPDFDYAQKAAERLEIPIADRIAAIRAQKAKARSRQNGFAHPGESRGTPRGQAGHYDGGRQNRPQNSDSATPVFAPAPHTPARTANHPPQHQGSQHGTPGPVRFAAQGGQSGQGHGGGQDGSGHGGHGGHFGGQRVGYSGGQNGGGRPGGFQKPRKPGGGKFGNQPRTGKHTGPASPR